MPFRDEAYRAFTVRHAYLLWRIYLPTPTFGNGRIGPSLFIARDLRTTLPNITSRMMSAKGICMFLRGGFVIPSSPRDEYWNSNPPDAGCYMNHSSTPNCGRSHGTLSLVHAGEEFTVEDYSGNGNPKWHIGGYEILTMSAEMVVRETTKTERARASQTSTSG
jgi:hypothetical protein